MKDKKVLNSLIYALIIGIICGIAGVIMNYLLKWTGQLRGSMGFYVQLAVMVALGPVVAGCYKWLGTPDFKATDAVVQSARDGQEFPLKTSLSAAVGLLLTCLTESSGVKEGSSFQVGAPIAHWIGKKLNIEAPERRLLTMCAIAAGFASILGTPFFAAFLAAEVAFNKIEIKNLPYTIVSAAAAYLICYVTKAPVLRYATIDFGVEYGALDIVKFVAIAAVAGALGRFFLHALGWTGKLTGMLKNPYVRILVGGAVGAVLCILLKTQVYLSGGNIVAPALKGEGNWYDFLLKMFFLLLMSKVGYKTGFLPQNIAIGGAFGGAAALLLGADPAIGAAAGMIGFVGGVTCCPIAALALACDMFKFNGMGFVLWILFAGVGTLCGGFHGYYSTRKAPAVKADGAAKAEKK